MASTTAEFFPVGLFAAGLALFLTLGRGVRTGLVVADVALFCLLCSLGAQVHKIFVPGREFDAVDLLFDAVGYGAGIALAWPVFRRPFRFASVFTDCFAGLHH